MVKQVNLRSGITFKSIAQAKNHFSDIRESYEAGSQVSEPDFSDIIDVYQRYCQQTKWDAVLASGVIANWENRERSSGKYAQTKAFHIVDEHSQQHVFSIDKALTAVAE